MSTSSRLSLALILLLTIGALIIVLILIVVILGAIVSFVVAPVLMIWIIGICIVVAPVCLLARS